MNWVSPLAILVAASCVVAPAIAADKFDLRPSYEPGWEFSDQSLRTDDSLSIEAGVRYWYSVGEQTHNVVGVSETIKSKSHSGEVFARVDDRPTRSFLEASGAYGFYHEGDYTTNNGAPAPLAAARLGYGAADFGWLPFGSDEASVGFVSGYNYTYDSTDTGRVNFTTAKTAADVTWSDTTGNWTVGGDSQINEFHTHAMKLGLAGRIDMGGFDITGEAAATPYAWVSGTYGSAQAIAPGAFGGGPNTVTQIQSSPVSVNGFGYGASGKLMFGVKPTENLAVRIGGRASYLQGSYDANYTVATVTSPVLNAGGTAYTAPSVTQQQFVQSNNPFSMMRYGLLFELSGRF